MLNGYISSLKAYHFVENRAKGRKLRTSPDNWERATSSAQKALGMRKRSGNSTHRRLVDELNLPLRLATTNKSNPGTFKPSLAGRPSLRASTCNIHAEEFPTENVLTIGGNVRSTVLTPSIDGVQYSLGHYICRTLQDALQASSQENELKLNG